jgi:DNA-binding response OmpR family regulator
MASSLILIVDHNQQNLELLAQVLTKEGYQMKLVSTLDAFAQVITEQVDELGMALVDISGFDRRIWGYCEQLSESQVPLLVIAPQRIAQIQRESVAHGAQGVLYKPLAIRELTTIVRNMIRGNSSE